MQTQNITVDLTPGGIMPRFRLKQGDVGRPLAITVMDNGAALAGVIDQGALNLWGNYTRTLSYGKHGRLHDYPGSKRRCCDFREHRRHDGLPGDRIL